ncbi:MAG: hypothetical protein ABF316_14235, partial [Marivita sp.]
MTKRSPFKYFKTSPEIIRLAVMLYVRLLPSLRQNFSDKRYLRWGECRIVSGISLMLSRHPLFS